MRTPVQSILPAAAALMLAAGHAHATEPVAVTSVVQSRLLVEDYGQVNSGFITTPSGQGGRGIWGVAVAPDASWLVRVDTPNVNRDRDEAMLWSAIPVEFGFVTAYIGEGRTGFLSAPSFAHVVRSFGAMDLNAAGLKVQALDLLPFEGADPATAVGVVMANTNRVLLTEGTPASGLGLPVGATWSSFDLGSTWLELNANNELLLTTKVDVGGQLRTVVAVLQLDGSGQEVSRRLVAAEQGSAGPLGLYSQISTNAHTSALNDNGSVIYTARTTSGPSGVFRDGSLILASGANSPVSGKNWGDLYAAPVDHNNNGDYAVRGLAAEGDGIWNETAPDAGEEYEGQNGVNTIGPDQTAGNGPIIRIIGSLSNDADVDMYRIRITDFANFRATTVPNPGAGFPGAAFDTALYLIRTPGRGTRGIVRNDDALAGVPQSTITSLMLPPEATSLSDNEYYLVVATPKSTPWSTSLNFATQTNQVLPMWAPDPTAMRVVGGTVYWADPSAGQIGRVTSAGSVLSPLQVAEPPRPTQNYNVGEPNPNPLELVPPFAVTGGATPKVYWIDRQWGDSKVRRANIDGTGVETIIQGQQFIPAFGASAIAADATVGKIFWARPKYGEIYRANLDGSNPDLMIKIPEEITVGVIGSFAPTRIVIDPVGNRVYWNNPVGNTIQSASVNTPTFSGPSAVTTIITSANATDIAVDGAAGKVYWTDSEGNAIRRANLNGTGQEVFLATPRPHAVSVDASTGRLYWSNVEDREIRWTTIAAPGAGTVVHDLGPDTSEVRADGIGFDAGLWEWRRSSPGAGGALPYQVSITGATFRYEDAIIARNNTTKIATFGDIPAEIPDAQLVRIGSSTGPIKIDDGGRVLWHGLFTEPTNYINILSSAMWLNDEVLLRDDEIPAGFSDKLIFFWGTGPMDFDLTRDGRYAMISANTQEPPFNFTFQSDRAILVELPLPEPPGCPADWDGSGGIDGDDIGAFFADWQIGEADIDQSGGTDGDDITYFFERWQAGC